MPVSFEMAKKLKECGWKKETVYHWADYSEPGCKVEPQFQTGKVMDFFGEPITKHYPGLIDRDETELVYQICFPAPSLEELLEELPMETRPNDEGSEKWIAVEVKDFPDPDGDCCKKDNNPCDAAAKLWIKLERQKVYNIARRCSGKTTMMIADDLMKSIKFEIPVPVYGTEILVFVGYSCQFKRWLKSKFNVDCDRNIKSCDGYYLSIVHDSGTERRIIWFSPEVLNFSPYDYGIISHEVAHAVRFLMDWIGCKLCPETDEPYACLQGYLVEQIIINLKKHS